MKFKQIFSKIINSFNKKRKLTSCQSPYLQAFIYPDGKVYTCPDCFMAAGTDIGNLNDNSFSNIWDSEKAKYLREGADNKDLSFCFHLHCINKANFHMHVLFEYLSKYKIKKTNKYPKIVTFGVDSECNASCVMCRKAPFKMSKEELDEKNAKIKKTYLPLLKKADFVTLSTTSDPFASRHTSLLIKEIAKKYKHIKFNLITNGILSDKKHCDSLGITDRLECVMVSVHAATKETYDKIVLNGNFDRVCENLNWLKEMKESGKISRFFMAFVVSSRNYKEMPMFAEFAKKNGAIALFWPCVDWGGNLSYYEDLCITDPAHINHCEFVKTLQTNNFEDEYSHLSFSLAELAKSKL